MEAALMKKLILRILLTILFTIIVIGGIFVFNGYQMYKDALDTISLQDKVSQIQEDTSYLSLENLPENYKNAVVSVEDRRYYDHGPIDFIAITRAIVTNIKNQEFLEGGSTITQQVAKNLYFISTEKNSALRKVA